MTSFEVFVYVLTVAMAITFLVIALAAWLSRRGISP